MRSCVIFFLKSLECLNFWDNKGARWFFSLAVFFFMSFVWMPVCMFTEYRTFRPLLPHVIIYLFLLLLLCHQSYIWYFSLSVGFFFIFSLSFCLLLSLLTYVSFLLYLYKSFSVSLSLSICFTESAAPFRQSLPLSIRPWQRVGKKEKKKCTSRSLCFSAPAHSNYSILRKACVRIPAPNTVDVRKCFKGKGGRVEAKVPKDVLLARRGSQGV